MRIIQDYYATLSNVEREISRGEQLRVIKGRIGLERAAVWTFLSSFTSISTRVVTRARFYARRKTRAVAQEVSSSDTPEVAGSEVAPEPSARFPDGRGLVA
jgi:hypothetical protein